MKKLLLLLLLSLGLIGCSSTSDLASPSPSPQVTVDGETYNWKRWNCYDFFDDHYILGIGYVPEISDSKGILFLKDSESGIDTIHSLQGVQHHWEWDDFKIVIQSDGDGYFYDFTGAISGEKRAWKEDYKCYIQ